MMVAACGIELDDPVLIAAAVVLGPTHGPTDALATALSARRWRSAEQALLTLLAAFAAGIALTALFGVTMRVTGLYEPGGSQQPHPNTGFIWRSGVFSFVVSWLGGAATALSNTAARVDSRVDSRVDPRVDPRVDSRVDSLAGALVSLATIPAAAAVAIDIDERRYAAGGGAAQQWVISLAGVVLAGALVRAALRRRSVRERRPAVAATARPAG
ncbi:DUF389 domain-containing protein [Actinospica durhamensis]|uniref:DUF389 domain-containing protein n=2 Tax=Actinospica durhamensis TaxID=1508375 RepID=A0A941IUQ4_9ACTN|nr:DUF389 domain-containing protein [Actinospica durhamensis]